MLGPRERVGVLVIGGDKGIDLLAHLSRRGEAGAGQGIAGEDREPDFDLVQPRGVGRREVKMDVLVARPPAIVFRLMGVQIVQDDVQLAAGMRGDEAVHEVEELDPAATPVVAGLDQTGGDIQRRKQRRRAVALVGVAETGQRLAIGQPEPSLSAFQSLDVGLFIDRQHHRILRRLQIEPDNVGDVVQAGGIASRREPDLNPFRKNECARAADAICYQVAERLGD